MFNKNMIALRYISFPFLIKFLVNHSTITQIPSQLSEYLKPNFTKEKEKMFTEKQESIRAIDRVHKKE